MSSFLLWAPRQLYDLSTLPQRYLFTMTRHAFRENLLGSFRESERGRNFTLTSAT